MLFDLVFLKDLWSPLNLFQYITFRAGGAFFTTFVLMVWWGKPFVTLLKRLKMEQAIRECGPATHLAKAGTPTMGGLLMLLTLTLATLLWARWDNRFVWLSLGVALILGAVGFVDDYRKWLKKHPSGGLSSSAKMLALVAVGLAVGTYLYFFPPNEAFDHRVSIPYTKDVTLYLGGFMVAFVMLVLVGSANAVNLTDGIDGLASGTLAVSAMAYAVLAYLAGHAKLSEYLRLVPVAGAGELAVFLAAIVGAVLGFLWHNAHPADLFMGDTGSLSLGGSIGLAALCVKQELLLVVVGGVFVAEALSVLMQVVAVRLCGGRRVFRMAPLHHHYELGGLAEQKVTIRFWIVAIVLALIALTSVKIR